uniref:Uncharacterized protein n=1 Tax=Papio anubis TaxID=9555 RepID=A0A8I5R961_PAPAN
MNEGRWTTMAPASSLLLPSTLLVRFHRGKGVVSQEVTFLLTFVVMEDRRPDNSTFVSIEESSRQKKPWKEAEERSFCLAEKAPLAAISASSVAVPAQRTPGKRSQKMRNVGAIKAAPPDGSPPASGSASSGAVTQLKSRRRRDHNRNIRTVNYIEGTKVRMNKRRRPSYRPEDQEAFYRLLEDPVIHSFLEADIFLKVSDKLHHLPHGGGQPHVQAEHLLVPAGQGALARPLQGVPAAEDGVLPGNGAPSLGHPRGVQVRQHSSGCGRNMKSVDEDLASTSL